MSIRLLRTRLSQTDDDGFSLTEVIISMGLFSVLLAVMMTAVVQWSSGAVRTSQAADLATEAGIVFDTFDKNVLSASDINRPVKVGADWYVEVLDTTVVPQRCTQWVLRSTGQVQMRSWSTPISGKILAPAWSTKGTRFLIEPGVHPFRMMPVTGSSDRQRLTVELSGRVGAKSPIIRTNGSFAARNSTVSSTTNPDVSPADGVSDTQVCLNNFSDVSGGRA